MFEIIIKNLKLFGYHGVNPEEKINGQEFVFDLKIIINKNTFRIDDSGKYDDNILGTISYSEIIRLVKKINSSNKFDLLETLSEEIAQKIFGMSSLISALEVCVKKPNPPIDESMDYVGARFKAERGITPVYVSEKTFYLSIGSNIGNREENIRSAVNILSDNKNLNIIGISSIYESEPLYFKKQDSFYNIVLKGSYSFCDKKPVQAAFELLGFLKFIEFAMKRTVSTQRNGPRIIDLDLVNFCNIEIISDFLTLPHPKFKERNFVLVPLEEVEPNFIVENISISEFIRIKKPEGKITKITGW